MDFRLLEHISAGNFWGLGVFCFCFWWVRVFEQHLFYDNKLLYFQGGGKGIEKGIGSIFMMSNSHAAETFPPELCPPPPLGGK